MQIKKTITILVLAAVLSFGSVFEWEKAPYQSTIECQYELHQLQNEFYTILGYAFAINGFQAESKQNFAKIWIYPHEELDTKQYLKDLIKRGKTFKGDLDAENEYLLKRLGKKQDEYEQKLKACIRNYSKIRKEARRLGTW